MSNAFFIAFTDIQMPFNSTKTIVSRARARARQQMPLSTCSTLAGLDCLRRLYFCSRRLHSLQVFCDSTFVNGEHIYLQHRRTAPKFPSCIALYYATPTFKCPCNASPRPRIVTCKSSLSVCLLNSEIIYHIYSLPGDDCVTLPGGRA